MDPGAIPDCVLFNIYVLFVEIVKYNGIKLELHFSSCVFASFTETSLSLLKC